MSYVDGFVLAVPKKNVKAYEKVAKTAARIWKKHGALEFRECLADDLDTKMALTFKKMLKLKPSEVAFFSYITFKSRAHRDAVNKKVIADPETEMDPKDMPFDMRRMAYGGFKTLVSR
jgi:uncharacterized protein YbaA (DUF1428 family)